MKKHSKSNGTGRSPDSRHGQITPDGIRNQLDRVLSSPDFKASERVKSIFRVLTEESLSGSEGQMSASKIADKASKGSIDSSPPIDPIVRIQVNQLRRSLKGYYAGAGATDEGPQFELPEGSFTPVFHSNIK